MNGEVTEDLSNNAGGGGSASTHHSQLYNWKASKLPIFCGFILKYVYSIQVFKVEQQTLSFNLKYKRTVNCCKVFKICDISSEEYSI